MSVTGGVTKLENIYQTDTKTHRVKINSIKIMPLGLC